jgi:hypothetical protein
MTIYLHIGTPKTGTTSIQTFVDVNAAALAERGFVVPTSLGKINHRRLVMYAMDERHFDSLRRSKRIVTPESVRVYRGKFLPEFRSEIAGWRPDQSIIMTSEFLMRLRRIDELERLKDLLLLTRQTDIRVIVYLRRQDLYYTSGYSQSMKGGKEFVFAPEGEISEAANYYDRNLEPWAKVFGQHALVVRPFERSALKNGDAVDDFMFLLGLNDLSGFQRPPIRNESLDAYTVEFLRRVNRFVPRKSLGKENRVRMRLIQALEALSDGPKLQMTRANAERFLQHFEESNRTVARTYLGQDVLFREPVAEAAGMEPTLPLDVAQRIGGALLADTILPRMDTDQLLEATAQIWNEFVKPRFAAPAGAAAAESSAGELPERELA